MSLALAAILVLMTAGSLQPRTYTDIVALYRRGEPDRAIAEAKARTLDAEFNEQADQWREKAVRAKSSIDLQAALLLHSEVAFNIMDMELSRSSRPIPGARTRITTRIKRLHDDLAEIERRSPFLRNWYLLWGAFLQSRNATDVDPSVNFFSIALREFPDDPTVLLMAGCAKEITWWVTIKPVVRPVLTLGVGSPFTGTSSFRVSNVIRSDDTAEKLLDAFVDETGGRVIYVENEEKLQTTFVQTLSEFRQRYVLSYSPTNVSGQGWHTLNVNVLGRRAQVKARRGYAAEPASRGGATRER